MENQKPTEKVKRNPRKQLFKFDISVIFVIYLFFSFVFFATSLDMLHNSYKKQQSFNEELIKEITAKTDELRQSIDEIHSEIVDTRIEFMYQSDVNDKTKAEFKKHEINLQNINKKLNKLENSLNQLIN